jgi:hypothetical protein
MRSARNRSFRPEISGLKLEGRQLLSAAGGVVARTAAVVVSHPVHPPTPAYYIGDRPLSSVLRNYFLAHIDHATGQLD